jgi:hypothetical protein
VHTQDVKDQDTPATPYHRLGTAFFQLGRRIRAYASPERNSHPSARPQTAISPAYQRHAHLSVPSSVSSFYLCLVPAANASSLTTDPFPRPKREKERVPQPTPRSKCEGLSTAHSVPPPCSKREGLINPHAARSAPGGDGSTRRNATRGERTPTTGLMSIDAAFLPLTTWPVTHATNASTPSARPC